MNNYKNFDDWFNELEGYSFRSERFFCETKCPDPFKQKEILTEWLKTAWQLGYESAKKAKV